MMFTRRLRVAQSVRATKKPAFAGFFAYCGSADQAAAATGALSLRTAMVRRLLWRAALFLWMKPCAEMRSMIGTAAFNADSAPGWSPASMALTTFLMAVRSIERTLELWALRLSA